MNKRTINRRSAGMVLATAGAVAADDIVKQ